jgi:NADPH:quinone reductase-like Zn-dependent oxidoreductase
VQKITVHAPGSYDRLRVETAADPEPGPGEIRVRVAHAGVNYADCIVRMGLYESARRYVGWPITPGFEAAGVVDAVGDPVGTGAAAELVPGTAVMAVTRFSGYASHVVVPRHQAFPIPAGWSTAQAAAFPAVALTAHYALRILAAPRPGAHLLVHSAAGGVGSALCQLGRAAGCRVVAVVGAAHKVAAAERAGAHHVIDKSSTPLWPAVRAAAPDGYDAVFDANGVETLSDSYAALRPTGRLVIYGFHSMLPRRGGRPSWPRLILGYLRTPRFNPLQLTGDNKSVMAFNLSYLFERRELLAEAMSELLTLVAEGTLAPPEVRSFPFAEVAAAHRELESGGTTGKLVLAL